MWVDNGCIRALILVKLQQNGKLSNVALPYPFHTIYNYIFLSRGLNFHDDICHNRFKCTKGRLCTVHRLATALKPSNVVLASHMSPKQI